MRSIRRTIVLGLFITALGCADATPVIDEGDANIVGGETDTGDPSVVAVYAQQPGSDAGFLCTGSVIAPTVVLTAAHCVSTFETGKGATFTVLTSANVNRGGGQQLAVRTVHANPRWSMHNLEGGHDQGIVILSEPTSLPALPFNRQALDSTAVGRPLRLVGYGHNISDSARQSGAGVKREVLTVLRSVAPMLIGVGDSRHGTCNGDSGGPAFMKIDGVETIVGVTSYGNEDCSDGGFDARVDTDLAFIDSYVPKTCAPACDGRSCGADGCGGVCGSCGTGELCSEEGACVSATDGCRAGGAEMEPNDSALLAGALCTDGGSHGTLSSTSDQDWFTFEVAADAVYDVTLSGGPPGAAVRVYKISSTGRQSFIADGPEIVRHTDAGGTYVARVSGGDGSAATYTLTVHTSP
jgi:V8-like Glu-specific endopeptidase